MGGVGTTEVKEPAEGCLPLLVDGEGEEDGARKLSASIRERVLIAYVGHLPRGWVSA